MDSYEALMERAMADKVPLFAHLELTARCNLRCSHCYVAPDAAKATELSADEWVDVLGQLARESTLFVTFSGGEPLLRPDALEIAAAAVSLGFAYRLFTNGTLIEESHADALASLPPVAVEVSVYGADAATHDAVTGAPGSFEQTLRGIRLLVDRGVRVVVKSPMMRDNFRQLDALRRQAQQLGCEFKYDAMITARLDGNRGPLTHRLTHEGYRALLADSDDAQAVTFVDMDEPFCTAAHTRVCISPAGEVYPCVALPISAGSLRRQPFAEIWRQGDILRQLRAATKRDAAECVGCEYLAYCARCPGMAYVEDGDWKARSSAACELARARNEWAQERPSREKNLPPEQEMCYPTPNQLPSTGLVSSSDVFRREGRRGCPE
jgi:radical SAM protein with 4Fe4S-binding SPASM domain